MGDNSREEIQSKETAYKKLRGDAKKLVSLQPCVPTN